MTKNNKDRIVFEFLESNATNFDAFLLSNGADLIFSEDEKQVVLDQKNYIIKIKTGQITKKQHYVPAFYLSKFTNEEGRLHAIDLESKKILKKTYLPSSVCYDEYFYAIKSGEFDIVSQTWEAIFKYYEDKFAQEYDNIICEIMSYGHISEATLRLLAEFMAVSHLRTKSFREHLQRSAEEVMKKVGAMSYRVMKSSNPKHEMIKKVIESPGTEDMLLKGNYKIDFLNNTDHFQFMSDDHFMEWSTWFLIKKWRFLIAKGPINFVTSDTPVLDLLPNKKSTVYGFGIFEREQVFPLSPRILIVLSDPLEKGKQIKRKAVDSLEVAFRNAIRLSFSRFGYSSSYNELDEGLSCSAMRANMHRWNHIFKR